MAQAALPDNLAPTPEFLGKKSEFFGRLHGTRFNPRHKQTHPKRAGRAKFHDDFMAIYNGPSPPDWEKVR